MTKKVVLAAASSMLAATLVFAAAAQPAYATSKVDCDAVMNEVNSGKRISYQLPTSPHVLALGTPVRINTARSSR